MMGFVLTMHEGMQFSFTDMTGTRRTETGDSKHVLVCECNKDGSIKYERTRCIKVEVYKKMFTTEVCENEASKKQK